MAGGIDIIDCDKVAYNRGSTLLTRVRNYGNIRNKLLSFGIIEV